MVSLTSLLVLVSLFTQTTANIPKTSYMKLIDIWFLSLIVLDFLVIFVVVCIEHYRQQMIKLPHPIKLHDRKLSPSRDSKLNTASARYRKRRERTCTEKYYPTSVIMTDTNTLPLRFVSNLIINPGQKVNALNKSSKIIFPFVHGLFLISFFAIAIYGG